MGYTAIPIFNEINRILSSLAFEIDNLGKLNYLNNHVYSENFYERFLKKVYDWDLINFNKIIPNATAIDLIDNKKKIIVQVTASTTKQKVNLTLKKSILKKYRGYSMKFLYISKHADTLRTNTYFIRT